MIFAADEDVGDVAAGGDAGDGDAFEQRVGIVIHQVTIFKSSRLRFVGIDRQVMVPLLFLRDERPFLPRAESRPAAPAQAGVSDGLDDLIRLHLQRLAQRRISAGADVLVIRHELALVGVVGDALQEDGFGKCHDFYPNLKSFKSLSNLNSQCRVKLRLVFSGGFGRIAPGKMRPARQPGIGSDEGVVQHRG